MNSWTRKHAATWVRALIGSLMLIVISAPGIAAPVSVEPYGQLPAVEQVAISPNGQRIAVATLVNEQRQIVVLGAQNKLELNIPIGDTKLVGLYWAGNDMLLIRHRSTAALGLGFTAAKTELESVLIATMDGSPARDVFQKNHMIVGGIRGYFGLNQRNSQWYGYFGGITLQKNHMINEGELLTTNPDLYEVELGTGKTRRIGSYIEGELNWRDWIVSPDGAVAASIDLLSDSGNWKLRNAKQEVIQRGQSPKGGVGLLGFGTSTEDILYYVTDDQTGQTHHYQISQSSSTPTELLPNTSVSTLIHDPWSRILLGYKTNEDYPKTIFFNEIRADTLKSIYKAFPGLSVSLEDWSRDFTRLIVFTEGAQDPGTWWKIDMQSGAADALRTSYRIPPTQVAPYQMISYVTQDGTTIEGVLTLPAGREAKNLPAIMLPHGGPAARDYPHFDWWAQAFAAQGYAVFQPNFRGSTGYGVVFEQAGHGEWGKKMQTDISDGLADLVKKGLVDPKRVCIMGGSYGGYAALAGVTLQKGLYRCAVSVAGIGDVNDMYRQDISESGYNQTMIRLLKDSLGDYHDFKDISPINFVDRADAPVLLIHGKDDTVVDYSQSTNMEKALRKAGKPVTLITLNGEDHWLSKSTTRLQMLKAAAEFIHQHNPAD